MFGKMVAGQPHAGLSLSAPYRHVWGPWWHTDRSLHPDMTPFSASTAPHSSDPRLRPSWRLPTILHRGLANITHRALRLSCASRTVANGCGVSNVQGSPAWPFVSLPS